MPADVPEEARISFSPLHKRNMTPDKRSSGSVYCRICHEDSSLEELIDPCECSGTLGLIHTSCLEKWLSTSNTDRCEICKYNFVIQKKHKPVSQWWASRTIYGPQGITGDVICFVILTPLCIVAAYLCGVGATAYAKLGSWEGTGLAVLCCLLIATYCLWLAVTIRFHFNSWQQWSRRNQDVKLVVKHKTKDPLTSANQDENNNTSNNNGEGSDHGSKFLRWLFRLIHERHEDASHPLRQETTLV